MEEEIIEQEITLEDENITVVAGTQDYEELDNKPSINNVELIGNKSLDDLGIDQDFVKDNNYVHTDNNYTTEEKTKLAGLSNYDDTEVKNDISSLNTNKADKSTTYTKTEVDNLIPDVSSFIDKNVNDLTYYTLGVDTGHSIELSINSSTYVLTLSLKNSAGTILNTNTVDLPLETMVVNGNYDSTNKKIVLTLQNGNTIDVPVGDLISGLQTEITTNNKLSADLVDDTSSTNKFFSGNYNDLSNKPDLTNYVQNTDYASSTGGVVKINGTLSLSQSNGFPYVNSKTYAQYQSGDNGMFIGKGTLENVITGKDLTTKAYVDGLVGDINTVLATLTIPSNGGE